MVSGSCPSGDIPANATRVFQALPVIGVDLVAVAMTLGDSGLAIDLGDRDPARIGLVGAQAHGAAEVAAWRRGCSSCVAAHPFGHQPDDGFGGRAEFGRVGAWEAGQWRATSITASCMPKQMPR